MILQLSSGMGPVECRVAVGGIYRKLLEEFPDMEVITGTKGEVEESYSSILLSSEADLSGLEGTMEWICKSKYRPGHKRKNWFVDASIIHEAEEIDEKLDMNDVHIEKFHSGGPGGQNVNKVETGIRVIHIPTGITVSSTRERSQFMNKLDALKKLSAILKQTNTDGRNRQKNDAWSKHAQIVRGNPVRIYEGEDFRLTFCKKNEENNNI
ncbi:peptide chain release factor [Butyrivibrio sp. ob235]|uniref:peptide chain release factor H n=1 Tax=Butyrivibrio sp. ob235 TaxID=1761780 RepID=UPI0008ACCD02|nr:peptide chain release factor H [Butyrivibrio sp. ob235]SEM39354.1 peptide chain release factor [Butyrivibrio sp. ob235]